MAQKDRNGEAYSKEDTVTEEKEMESDRAQTEEEDSEDSRAWPSCRLTAHTVHTVQETALWSSFSFLMHKYTFRPTATLCSLSLLVRSATDLKKKKSAMILWH